MSRESVLSRARAAAESGMADTCTIRRTTSEATDPNSGVITPTKSVIYTGKCRFQQHRAQANQQDAGQANILLLQIEVQLPMTVVGLQVDDEVTCDTATYDPDLPGRVFRIRDLAHKTEASARRVQATERTS